MANVLRSRASTPGTDASAGTSGYGYDPTVLEDSSTDDEYGGVGARCFRTRAPSSQRKRRLPGPGDGPLTARVRWSDALDDTGWLPRSRLDLSGSAGWRGDLKRGQSQFTTQFKRYATDDWPTRGVAYGILAKWRLRWNGPLSQWSGKQSAEGEGKPQLLLTRRQRLSRVAQQSKDGSANYAQSGAGTNPERYEAYMMTRLLRYERAKTRSQMRLPSSRRSILRRLDAFVRVMPALYVTLGMGISYATVCIVTVLGGQLGAFSAILALIACTAGAVLLAHVSTSRRVATLHSIFLWTAVGVLAAMFPAMLSAAAILTARLYATAKHALHVAPSRWAALAPHSSRGTVPVAYLDSFPGEPVYLLSDAVLRLDILGTGISYWPLASGTSPGKASVADVVGVTPGWAVPVTTTCAVPLVDASIAMANLTDPAALPPAAWVVCHNAGAGEASCTDAFLGNYTPEAAAAHEALATCLQDLSMAPQPTLLYALTFDAYWGLPDVRTLAAPAVRDAILRNGLPNLEYDGIIVLRLGTSCCDQQPAAAATRAAATGAAMGVTVLVLTGASRWMTPAVDEAKSHRPSANAKRQARSRAQAESVKDSATE